MITATNANKVEHDSPGVDIMPPTVFFFCLTLGGVLEFLIPLEFPMLSTLSRIVLGIGFGGAGFVFMTVANEMFKRTGTNVPTNQPATSFVAQGAYRYSRNPMYVGGSFFFLGIGLAAGSLWILVAYLPLFLYLALYVIPREEAYMEREFGEEYKAYCRSVRRWI